MLLSYTRTATQNAHRMQLTDILLQSYSLRIWFGPGKQVSKWQEQLTSICMYRNARSALAVRVRRHFNINVIVFLKYTTASTVSSHEII